MRGQNLDTIFRHEREESETKVFQLFFPTPEIFVLQKQRNELVLVDVRYRDVLAVWLELVEYIDVVVFPMVGKVLLELCDGVIFHPEQTLVHLGVVVLDEFQVDLIPSECEGHGDIEAAAVEHLIPEGDSEDPADEAGLLADAEALPAEHELPPEPPLVVALLLEVLDPEAGPAQLVEGQVEGAPSADLDGLGVLALVIQVDHPEVHRQVVPRGWVLENRRKQHFLVLGHAQQIQPQQRQDQVRHCLQVRERRVLWR